MPCRDERDNEPRTVYVYKDGHDPWYKELCDRQQARLDMLADLLCKVGRARKNKTNIPPKVIKWWEDHCKHDASRGEPW